MTALADPRPLNVVNPLEADAPATAAEVTQFHVSLSVADLFRSVRFYEMLFNRPPVLMHGPYARFELEKPAMVLVLYGSPRPAGGALSHVGLRMGTSAELVDIQQRLEMAGIPTQSQEGVECCYAKQTKFWVTDPDGVLWELYMLEHDLDHSGFDDPPLPKVERAADSSWTHRLTDPLPNRIPHDDGSLDAVKFEGTFNIPLTAEQRSALLGEAMRVLKPGGKVVLHGLVSDKPFPGVPNLPGMASVVRHVPVESDGLRDLTDAGFVGLFFETLSDVNCIGAPGVDLRHSLLAGYRPVEARNDGVRYVLYRGPFDHVRDKQGNLYRRGHRVSVSSAVLEQLRQGPAADQFTFPACH